MKMKQENKIIKKIGNNFFYQSGCYSMEIYTHATFFEENHEHETDICFK